MIALNTKSNPGIEGIELFLRLSRRRFGVLLLVIGFLWVTVLAMAFWPATWLAEWPMRFPLLFPILVLMAVMVLRLAGDRRRWLPGSPEAKLVLNDEFRRVNLLRAQRIAS